MCFCVVDCINYIVGKLSDYINPDSDNTGFRKFSEITIDQEIRWCVYLGISNILVTVPVTGSFVNLARIIYSKFKATHASPTVISFYYSSLRYKFFIFKMFPIFSLL